MPVTVRQKVKGKGKPWHVFIHHNGKIKSRTIGDKRAAEAMASKLRKAMASGIFDLEDKKALPLFRVYADHYVKDYAMVATKRNTWKNYETIINLHLLPVWKNKRLDEIKRADVKKLLLEKQKKDGLAPATVENIKALVSGIFTHAYEEEILHINPALKLGKFIQKDDRRRHLKPLSKEQVPVFLTTTQHEFPNYYALLLCAFRTGLRMGELLGLAWEDIDFEGNRIEVKRSYSHGNFSTPKSHKSRVVDMSDQLRQVLLCHRSVLTQKMGGSLHVVKLLKKFKPANIRLVFPNKHGEAMDGDNFRKRIFYKLLEKSELPRFRFHDIRHTFASLLLQQREPLNYVMEQMGHASIQTTVNVYGHIIPSSNRNAVNKLDDELAPELRLVTTAS